MAKAQLQRQGARNEPNFSTKKSVHELHNHKNDKDKCITWLFIDGNGLSPSKTFEKAK